MHEVGALQRTPTAAAKYKYGSHVVNARLHHPPCADSSRQPPGRVELPSTYLLSSSRIYHCVLTAAEYATYRRRRTTVYDGLTSASESPLLFCGSACPLPGACRGCSSESRLAGLAGEVSQLISSLHGSQHGVQCHLALGIGTGVTAAEKMLIHLSRCGREQKRWQLHCGLGLRAQLGMSRLTRIIFRRLRRD
eukprot:COSAG02_NODE_110_length_36062_cov_85.812106_26_plen_193_part_00